MHSTSSSQRATTWRDLIKLTLPIAMGYYAAGIAYGILGVSAGLPLWLVVLMSVFVYTGAGQYAALPLFAAAAGFFPIVINTFLISLRQIFYTLALHADLPKQGWRRWYSTFSITDESYALVSTQPTANRASQMTRIHFLCQFYWVSASLLGALLGAEVTDAIPHLSFALPCLFIILAYEQYRQAQQISPIFLALIAFVIAKLFAADWLMLAAILLCIVVILVRYQASLLDKGARND